MSPLLRRIVVGAAVVVAALVVGFAVVGDDGSGGAILTSAEPSEPRNSGARPHIPRNSTTTTVAAPTTTLPPRATPALLPATGRGPLDGLLIVVDPGHNGRNFLYGGITREDSPFLCNSTGSTSTSGTPEYEINWDIGRELTAMLNRVGAAVLLTHADNDGFGPCADERGAFARDHDAAAFVSLHADGSPSGSGFHVIHPAPHPNLSTEAVSSSAVLAAAIRDALVAVGGRPANYVGTAGVQERSDLANLNTADRPSVLVELGNIRNPIDARMLEEPSSQRILAAAIARSVLALIGKPTDPIAVRGDVDGDGFSDRVPDYSTTATTTTSTTTTSTTTSISSTTTAPAPSSSVVPSTALVAPTA